MPNKQQYSTLGNKAYIHNITAHVPTAYTEQQWMEFVYDAVMTAIGKLDSDDPLRKINYASVKVSRMRHFHRYHYSIGDLFEALLLVRDLPLAKGEEDNWASSTMRELAGLTLRDAPKDVKDKYASAMRGTSLDENHPLEK